MPGYVYTARDKGGRRVRGAVEAADPRSAVETLRAQGLLVTGLTPDRGVWSGLKRRAPGRPGLRASNGRLGARSLGVFCRQMATLLEAGVPVVNAMRSIAEKPPHRAMAGVLVAVVGDVEGGVSLSEAVSRQGDRFPPIVRQMLAAAEAGGFLDAAFRRLAEHFEKEDALNEKIRSATLYPKIIAVAGLGMILLLFAFVLPNFAGLFQQLGVEQPWAVRVLMAVSSAVRRDWPLPSAVAAATALAVRRRIRTPEGRLALDRWKLRLPLLGQIWLKQAMARLFRNLGVLLESGVPLLQALDTLESGSGNAQVDAVVRAMGEEVRRGGNMLDPLRRHGFLPPLAAAVLASGEETGSLSAMLQRVADMYDGEVEQRLQRLVSLVEPAVIVVLGAIVGFILVSVFNPIFSIYQRF